MEFGINVYKFGDKMVSPHGHGHPSPVIHDYASDQSPIH